MSYDDGSEHDRRLVDIFNRYGIRASFNLNSGTLGQPCKITPQELPTLYRGHEVSCHTVNHPDLTLLTDEAVRREILDDRRRLEDLTGQPVRGLAYPFGTWDDRLVALLPDLGIAYARTAVCTDSFAIPERFLLWHTTCHHNRALHLAGPFLQHPGPDLALLYVWGHSYELDGFMSGDLSKNWDYLESLCRLLHGREDIYYSTTIELVDYLDAVRRLVIAASTVTNPSAVSVWLKWREGAIELPAGTSFSLATER